MCLPAVLMGSRTNHENENTTQETGGHNENSSGKDDHKTDLLHHRQLRTPKHADGDDDEVGVSDDVKDESDQYEDI